jgi:hypothetical protein
VNGPPVIVQLMCTRLPIYIFLLLVLRPASCNARTRNFFSGNENSNSNTFYGGLVGGINFSAVKGDAFAGYHKVGWNGGAVVYVRFTDYVGVSAELIFSQKGSKAREYAEDANGVGYSNNYDLNMNYVELPVMLYIAPTCLNNKFHMRMGASYARLVTATEKAERGFPVNIDPSLYPFRKYDVDFKADFSYMFFEGWFVNFQYSYSLVSFRDIANVPPGYGYGLYGQEHTYFSLRVMRLIK